MRTFKDDTDKKECCGTCSHHLKEQGESVWQCNNIGSIYYLEETQWNDFCTEWESRE